LTLNPLRNPPLLPVDPGHLRQNGVAVVVAVAVVVVVVHIKGLLPRGSLLPLQIRIVIYPKEILGH